MPIDYVVPMVFPDDPQWQSDWQKVGYVWGNEDNARWRSWGTEELLLRAVRKHMPWLRRIYVLLARESQVRPWMRAMIHEPGVEIHLAYHYDFIPEQFRPCFVSRTIEMFLKDIPGLSEQFIYGNDDMFPLSPLQPSDFFRDGKPCQHARLKKFPDAPNAFHRGALAGLNMIASDFGLRYSTRWIRNGHSLAPYLRSTCETVWERHGEEILATTERTKRTDKSYNQYLYFYWQHFSGNYTDYVPPRRFLSGAKVTAEEMREAILAPNPGILCINDNEKADDWLLRARLARESIAAVLGVTPP